MHFRCLNQGEYLILLDFCHAQTKKNTRTIKFNILEVLIDSNYPMQLARLCL